MSRLTRDGTAEPVSRDQIFRHVYVLYFIATMSFAGYFLSVLFCLLSMLISDSRFDLVWFRLSCDHGWIRSGSVNVKKQQQQHARGQGNINFPCSADHEQDWQPG